MLKETEGQLIGEAYGSLNITLQITVPQLTQSWDQLE